jgi:site-specific recombinase XerD
VTWEIAVPQSGGTLAGSVQEYVDFTESWLANRRLSAHTRDAYRRDVAGYLAWCAEHQVEPLRAMFTHVNEYARALEETVDPRTGRTLAATTVARKLSGLSSWYDFLVKLGVVAANPVSGADRPNVSRDHSATVGMSPAEVDALLRAAAEDGPRHYALITMLADLGLRVGEVIRLDLTDVGHERGHRTVRFFGKGGKPRRRALAPGTADALDRYLTQRAERAGVEASELSGPVFVSETGRQLDRHAVFRLVRKLAERAGIPSAAQLSPHSLRHAFATTARSEGVPLEDVQDAMGHADPRTTRRYDRDRHNLDRDPSYAIWAARARRGNGKPGGSGSTGGG